MWQAVCKGSVYTKLSCLVMGFGQTARGQIGKGLCYLAVQAAFVLYMLFGGGGALAALFSGKLGTKLSGERWNESLQLYEKVQGDNSFLILLYGVVALCITVAFLFLWATGIKGSFENDVRLKTGRRLATFRQDLQSFTDKRFYLLLLALPLTGLAVFTVMPLVFMTLIAFTDYDYAHMPPGNLFGWVGLRNFKTTFWGLGTGSGFTLVFCRVLLWTVVWAFFATFSNYLFGILLALLVQKKGIRFKPFWRSLFVLAIAVPQFVTLLLMQKILDGDGILNKILGTQILWLTDQRHFALLPRLSVLAVNLWIGVPYTLLMSTGILMHIPAEYYEAAKIDGAGATRIFFSVTMPYMLRITAPYLITQFVGNLNNFNVIWLLTGGGPVDNLHYGGGSQAQATDLLVTWLYRLTTDQNPKYNVASVIGIAIFALSSAFSLIAFRKANQNEEEFQ